MIKKYLTIDKFHKDIKELFLYFNVKGEKYYVHTLKGFLESDCVSRPSIMAVLREYYKPRGYTLKSVREVVEFIQDKKLSRCIRCEEGLWRRTLYGVSFPIDRIFPLSKEAYNNFAIELWKKRGKPRFQKRRIDGIIFGDPKTEWKTSFYNGWRKKAIVYRNIGCTLQINSICINENLGFYNLKYKLDFGIQS